MLEIVIICRIWFWDCVSGRKMEGWGEGRVYDNSVRYSTVNIEYKDGLFCMHLA